MNLHDVLDNLSEQSGRNQNILSSSERELLANILRHARNDGDGIEVVRCVDTIVARAVGETLLQRASEGIGRTVVEDLTRKLSPSEAPELKTGSRLTLSSPPPPATGPRPPAPSGPAPGPGGVATQRLTVSSPPPPATGPRPPAPSGPGPGPGGNIVVTAGSEQRMAAVADRPQVARAECVILEEFLAPEELSELTRYALGRESDFRVSEVISPGVTGTVIDPEYRRSRVLMDLDRHAAVIQDRIQSVLPRVLEKLRMEAFPITRVESQITASNDGDFFRHHSDNAEEEIATRQLTYVYFFHREPKAFEGGVLRLHDAYQENGEWLSAGGYQSIVPEQNQIVFFPSSLLHEITPVVCPSQAFADSRFTVNGWLHR